MTLGPCRFALYIASSASRSRVSGVGVVVRAPRPRHRCSPSSRRSLSPAVIGPATAARSRAATSAAPPGRRAPRRGRRTRPRRSGRPCPPVGQPRSTARRNGAQDVVADLVAVGVVDVLEPVDVAEQQRQQAVSVVVLRSRACWIRSVSSVRLGSPVSASCCAECASAASACRSLGEVGDGQTGDVLAVDRQATTSRPAPARAAVRWCSKRRLDRTARAAGADHHHAAGRGWTRRDQVEDRLARRSAGRSRTAGRPAPGWCTARCRRRTSWRRRRTCSPRSCGRAGLRSSG